MRENYLREQMVYFCRSLFERGLTFGSSGNMSASLDDGWLMTPTNCCFGNLDPARITKLDSEGNVVSGDPPTKEQFLHMAMYEQRPDARAVVHLHSTYTTAVSCLNRQENEAVLPPITAYFIMRVGKLAFIPYYPPGDRSLADAVRKVAADHRSIILANHGSLIADQSLEKAVYATEELEETAKLFFILKGHETNYLHSDEVAELERRFSS